MLDIKEQQQNKSKELSCMIQIRLHEKEGRERSRRG